MPHSLPSPSPLLLLPFTFLTLICCKWAGRSLWAHFLLSFHSGESEHLKNFKSRFIKMPGNYVQNFQPLSAAVFLSYSLSPSLSLYVSSGRGESQLASLTCLSSGCLHILRAHCNLYIRCVSVCLCLPSRSLSPSLYLTLLDKFA